MPGDLHRSPGPAMKFITRTCAMRVQSACVQVSYVINRIIHGFGHICTDLSPTCYLSPRLKARAEIAGCGLRSVQICPNPCIIMYFLIHDTKYY